MVDYLRRVLVLLSLACLSLFGVAACGGMNAGCSWTGCSVSLQRGVDVETEVLGVTFELVGVKHDEVTLEVNDSRVVLPFGVEVEEAGVTLSLEKLTEDEVTLRVGMDND